MPSQLPTTDALSRQVNTFGVGTYDKAPESEFRDEGDFEARGESLPFTQDDRGDDSGENSAETNFDAPYMGDQYSPVSDKGRTSSAVLPGDLDRPARSKRRPEKSIIQPVVQSVAESQLPDDKLNPPARSDYYDKTKVGESRLPGAARNDQSLDRFLGALGNMWSGDEYDDVAQPVSFPGTDRPPEEADKYTSVPTGASKRSAGHGRLMKMERLEGKAMERLATNLDLVGTLASDFLKKNSKQGLTRRHVMAFLREGGYHQYLASDIIRCLQQRHDVHVADVLDQFPVSTAKVASRAAAIREIIDIRGRLAAVKSLDPAAARTLKRCGDDMIDAVAKLVRGLQDG